MIATPLRSLAFRGTFRAYQQTVIEAAEAHASDGRVHIVAPPGAGKTVMGVELARFFGRPAVVFAPTTTIQEQWIETVGMFTDELTPELASDDPERLAALNAYTYQLISTQDHADEDFAEAAVRLWAESIVDEGRADEVEASLLRIAEIRENNPSWYRQEVAKYRKDLRRRMLREDPAALGSILHPNAQQLVESLVAAGIGTVVLDECHHLLDYWALVVRYLVSRIEEPAVIGLTATPAAPESEIEEENYFALLGDVDFEVPTPALVRERTLAPYRDLVRFVGPTAEELDFLHEADERLVQALGELTASPRFREWLHACLFGADPRSAWAAAVAADALFAFSGLRVLLASGVRPDVDVPEIATREPQLDDWLLVVERFALDVLAVSADASDHLLQRSLKAALKPFGITLTERGIRRGRSAVDRIVALSDAKAGAVVEILRLEREVLGPRLCAAVVCDFDREQAGADVAGSLRAGSARGVHGVLAGDAELAGSLAPTLVTAAGVCVPAGRADELCGRLQELAATELAPAPGDDPAVAWIAARDGTCTPKHFVDAVTDLLEAGEIGCVVGTRGLLAEGWDAPSLNVMADLTTATTPQTVQQLRGRTIRLDPDDAEKLAHNWDVVAYAPRIARGDNDLRRFLRRHEHTWGIVLGREYERAQETLELSDDAVLPAPIEKGPRHVDPDLVAELERIDDATHAPREADRLRQDALEEATERSVAAVPRRAAARAAWAIGGPSDVFPTESTRVRLEEPVRTVKYVATTTRSLLYALVTTFAFGAALVLAYAGGLAQSLGAWVVLLAAALLGGLVLSGGLLVRTLRRLLVEEPTDLVVLDIGRAVALALADAELIAMNRDTVLRSVWCRETPERELAVGLTGAPEDQRTFTIALREVFTVTGETRYLIRRTDARLPGFLSNAVWAVLRRLAARLGAGATKDHFLAVPRVLGRSRKRAETFARHWSRLVGGGQLVDTRDPEAATAILEARSSSRLRAAAQRLESFGPAVAESRDLEKRL